MLNTGKNPLFVEVSPEESVVVNGGIRLVIDSVNREVRIENANGHGNAAIIYSDSHNIGNNQPSSPYSNFSFPTSI
ncbi:MAG: hypothetical protein QNJ47_17690 [Nostocaceae cyanobacterium]|nr:hypothetical protein [Nostocaceae cyanobacterium]